MTKGERVFVKRAKAGVGGAVFAVMLGMIGTAQANPENSALYPNDGWVWRFSPVFGPQKYDGSVRVEGTRGSASASLSDIAKRATFQMDLQVDGHGERMGFLTDLSYVALNADFNDGSQSATLSASILSVDTLPSIGLDPITVGNTSTCLELLAGGRWNQFTADLRSSSSGSASASRGWVDPVVGGRITTNFDFPLRLEARSDWGGFGVGSATDLTWRFLGAAHYRPDPALEFFGGYRITDVKSQHQSGTRGTALDGRLSGPVIGITFVI